MIGQSAMLLPSTTTVSRSAQILELRRYHADQTQKENLVIQILLGVSRTKRSENG